MECYSVVSLVRDAVVVPPLGLSNKESQEELAFYDIETGESHVVLTGDFEEFDSNLRDFLSDYYKVLHSTSNAPSTVKAYQINTRKGCILPKLISTESSDHRQVLVILLPQGLGGGKLQLYHRSLGEELLPIAIECNGEENCLLVETQCTATSLFFSYAAQSTNDSTEDEARSITLVTALYCVGELHQSIKANGEIFSLDIMSKAQMIRDHFVEDSFYEFECFEEEYYKKLRDTLVECSKFANSVGPLDYRHYGLLDFNPSPPLLVSLHKTLVSDYFREWIVKLTGLNLVGLLAMELRELGMHSFQIFNDQYSEPEGLDVVINIVEGDPEAIVNDGCSIFYISDGEQVAKIRPEHNKISFAYRTTGCQRFIAYDGQRRDRTKIFQLSLTFKVLEK